MVVGGAGVFVIAALPIFEGAAVGDDRISAVEAAAIGFVQVGAIAAYPVAAIPTVGGAAEPAFPSLAYAVATGSSAILRAALGASI